MGLRDMMTAIDHYLDSCEGTFTFCLFQGDEFPFVLQSFQTDQSSGEIGCIGRCCPLVHRAIDSDGPPCLSLSPSFANGTPMAQASAGAGFGLQIFLNSGLRDQEDEGLPSGFQLHLNFAQNDEF